MESVTASTQRFIDAPSWVLLGGVVLVLMTWHVLRYLVSHTFRKPSLFFHRGSSPLLLD
jgi:hypothetical protein